MGIEETIKGKAEYLLNKFTPFHPVNDEEKKLGKQFAIACIDFHLKEFEDWSTRQFCCEEFDYEFWEEVKKEIEKL